MMPPRIRGKVGTFAEGPDEGKFAFELSLWDFYGEKQAGEPFVIGPFDTEEIAREELKKCAQLACEAIEKGQGFDPCGKYMDMKSGGIMRPWVNQ